MKATATRTQEPVFLLSKTKYSSSSYFLSWLFFAFLLLNYSECRAGGSGAICIYQDSLGNVFCSTYGNSGGTCGSGSLGSCNAEATAAGSSMDPSTCASIISAAGCSPTPSTFVCFDDPPPAPTTITMCFMVGNSSCNNTELCEAARGVLPVELIDFSVHYEQSDNEFVDGYNVISWSTASEYNSSHFELEYLTDDQSISPGFTLNFPAAGNSSMRLDYGFRHSNPDAKVNMYVLRQVDLDGNETLYGPISIDNSKDQPKLLKTVNMMGQEVDEFYTGVIIQLFDDGTTRRTYQY